VVVWLKAAWNTAAKRKHLGKLDISDITLEISAIKVKFQYGGVRIPLVGWRILLSVKNVFFKTTDTLAHVLDVVKYQDSISPARIFPRAALSWTRPRLLQL